MTAMANLTGLFYEKYAADIQTLYTASSILKDDIAFVESKSQNGGNFNQPVVMAPEQGFTYAAPSATPAPIAMNAAISMQLANAQVAPYQMMARCVLDYETANRSIAGRAFEPAAVLQMANVLEQASTRLELSLLYGQEGLGLGTTFTGVNATTATVTFSTATWSDATWGSAINASIQFWTNPGNVLVSTGSDSIFVVTKTNTSNKTITVTGTATGITALAAQTSADAFFFGTRTGAAAFNEMPGLSKICANVGVLFGIDASQYDLWRGNVFAVGATSLTFAKLQSAVAVAVGRGLTEDVNVYVNPQTWGNLSAEQAAYRRYDESYSTGKTQAGSKSLEFYGQSGKMTIKPHPFVKLGDAFVAPPSRLRRVGSTDITFQVPGPEGKNKDMFQDLQDSAGYQYKLYTGQTLFSTAPAKLVKLTGIVNS